MGEALTLDKKQIDYFGGCPECGTNAGYLNVGRDHWIVCDKHKTKWRIGSNLFSSWKEETADQWKQNAKRLSTYRKVEPIRDKKEVKKMVVEEKPRLLIKANNTIAKEYCPICGEVHKDTGIPWAIFVESSNACVCDRCVEKHDPQLGKMLFDGVDKWNKELEEKDKQKVMRRTKEEILEHYAAKNPQPFIQFDGFIDVEDGDSIVRPDEDRDSVFSGTTFELMSGIWGVRVLVRPDVKKETIIRILSKIITWLLREDETNDVLIDMRNELKRREGVININELDCDELRDTPF